MGYAIDDTKQLGVNTQTTGDNELIAAPGAGKYIAIDYFQFNPNGGGQTVILNSGTDEICRFVLDDNQPVTIENTIHDPKGIITIGTNKAFIFNLGGSTQITGLLKYRICETG